MSTNTAETVTEDRGAEPAPDTITEERIVPIRNEETENSQTSETPPDTGDAAAQPAPTEGEPKPDAKPPEAKRTRTRAMPDGTYVIRNPDGTEVTLSEDQATSLIRKRIDREVYRRSEAEREAERLRQELEAARTKPDTKPPDQQAQPQTDAEDPRPSWETQEWDSMDQYQDALYDWRRRQEARAAQPKPADQAPAPDNAEFTAWQKRAGEVLQDGAQRYSDWNDVVVQNQDAPFDGMFTNYVFTEAEDAAAVLYELGQHPDEARELHALVAAGDKVKAARVLGKLEARLDRGQRPEPEADDTGSPSTDEEAPAPRPAARRAPEPPPITPITTSRAGGVSTPRDPEKMNQREYEAWRAAGGGA